MYEKSIGCSALCFSLILGGCAGPVPQEQTGMVLGGALGGALGAQVGGGHGRTAATIAGTIAGAAIGGAVGRSMDSTDRMKVSNTLENSRTGTASQWRNPDSGNRYAVTPTRTYESHGTPCREYTVDGNIGGKKEKVTGTACRQADGSWRSVSD